MLSGRYKQDYSRGTQIAYHAKTQKIAPERYTAEFLYMECLQGQLLEGVECHIYLYCFTLDDINLNRAFVIIVLFPKKYSNKKVCANDIGKKNTLGIY